MKEHINILYLLGAGRSGTTLLATVLNNNVNINTVGELHHFYNYLRVEDNCSCGQSLGKCPIWSKLLQTFPKYTKEELTSIIDNQIKNEHHNRILSLLFGRKASKEYLNHQKAIYKGLDHKEWLLDSSKYLARYLSLKQVSEFNIKGIYVIRDIRGVIHSFSKNVQTPKSPIKTVLYYILINFLSQIVCWLDKDVIKIKYEDFIEDPEKVLNKICDFLAINNKINYTSEEKIFEMPHIVGGNRLKTNKTISIKKDLKWKSTISRPKQLVYYLLAFPLMLINKYKL
jgi:hypothetical protein